VNHLAKQLSVIAFFILLTFSIFSKIYHKNNLALYEDKTLAAIFEAASSTPEIGERSKVSDCQINGSFPDHSCTPGAIFSDAGTSTICVSGYTKIVRNVSTSLKKKVYAEYGISYPQPTGSYEADHLIPLELGGSNDIANLFPEAGDPKPGFKEKDLVENYLHNEVCAGNIPLDIAQKEIAMDWVLIYASFGPDQIEKLRNQYKSWAN
jgi:hypothetical protein